MGAGGIDSNIILLGISGMLAGALSMGAGEYISVKSQNELLEASHPHLATSTVVPQLDVDANELALVYRARGMSADEAKVQAAVFRCDEFHQPLGVFFVGGKLGECPSLVQDGEVLVDA